MAHTLPCEFYISLKGLCSDLQGEDKIRRKVALQQINKKVFNETSLNENEYREIFGKIQMYILKCVADSSEVCREEAILIVRNMVEKLDLSDYYLTYIFPVLVQRIGTAEVNEDSEELRLVLLNLLDEIIVKYTGTEFLAPFLNDIVQILSQSVLDKYPKVKEASCICIVKLANALPKHFHLQCESLLKPVLTCFSHQQYKVRTAAVEALGVIMLHGRVNAIQDSVGPLAERLFDQTSTVRLAVAKVAAKLMMEHRDRYSHFHRLLPLILTGLCDEVPEAKTETERLWEEVGLQYQKENEKDLKDQLDFNIEAPVKFEEGVKRPNLGCRVLVQRNVCKLVGALSNELTSWQDDVRLRCAQLLRILIIHCEDSFTQCLQDVLPAMYNTSADSERIICENMTIAARLIGMYVPARTWATLITSAGSQIVPSKTLGYLRVLKDVLSGTPREHQPSVAEDVYKLLSTEEFRCSRREEIRTEVLGSCTILASCIEPTETSFLILVSLAALSQPGSHVGEKATEMLRGVQDFPKFVFVLLEQFFAADASQWTGVSVERCILNHLMKTWPESLVQHLVLVVPILTKSQNSEADAEARLSTFLALHAMLQDDKVYQAEDAQSFLQLLIKDVLHPALQWHAGRTSEVMRTAAAGCLAEIFSHVSVIIPIPEEMDTLQTTLISLTEDAPSRTRIYAIKALPCVLLSEETTFITKWLTKTCNALVKRIDDPTDMVRIEAFASLAKVIDKASLEEVSLKSITDSVLLHVDDPNESIQNAAFDTLKAISRKDQNYLYTKVQSAKDIFINNKSMCDTLVEYMESLKM